MQNFISHSIYSDNIFKLLYWRQDEFLISCQFVSPVWICFFC